MATTIKLKNSVTTTNAPSSLVQGEVAINITDKKVWVGNAATTPIQLLGDGASLNFTSLSLSGNLTFTGTGNRITGDFSNATFSNRVAFQTSITNGNTSVGILPNGTGTTAVFQAYGSSDPTNSSRFLAGVNGNATVEIRADITGTGTYLPMLFLTGGSERLRIDTSGNVGIGITPSYRLQVSGTAAGSAIWVNANNTDSTVGSTAGFFASNGTVNSIMYANGNTGTGVFGTTTNHPMLFFTNNAERMRITSGGNVGIGSTAAYGQLTLNQAGQSDGANASTAPTILINQSSSGINQAGGLDFRGSAFQNGYGFRISAIDSTGVHLVFGNRQNTNTYTEAMRITSGGEVLVGKTVVSIGTDGVALFPQGLGYFTRNAAELLTLNRRSNDGTLVEFAQDGTVEGTISVSGTTVSYNGGHLSRYAQTLTPKDDSLLKGTVLSNLDEMNEYVDAEGNPVPNEQLNKVKVSDVEGDVNVAGVFVNWSHDEAHNVDEINMAMTGDMIIRIAEGVVVQKGDLLMSAGDGTAKPQGDDIVRSKTVAKVTSNHITCTYADGSYCVPCVLMAC